MANQKIQHTVLITPQWQLSNSYHWILSSDSEIFFAREILGPALMLKSNSLSYQIRKSGLYQRHHQQWDPRLLSSDQLLSWIEQKERQTGAKGEDFWLAFNHHGAFFVDFLSKELPLDHCSR